MRQPSPLDELARDYVRLCCQLNRLDPTTVEIYCGPPALRDGAGDGGLPAAGDIVRAADGLVQRVTRCGGVVTAARARQRVLLALTRAVAARAQVLAGKNQTLMRESAACFGMVPPHFSEAHFRKRRQQLEQALPGRGELTARLAAFDDEFRVGRERLREVLRETLHELRRRTRRCFTLPPYEQCELDYVADQPWESYYSYRGGAHSVIQVNTDRSLPLAAVIPLLAGAGYPGRHTRFCRAESDWYRQRGWVEHSIELMYSPRTGMTVALAEAAAGVVLPGAERLDFERRFLGPLAGFVPQQLERFQAVQAARDGLVAEAVCAAARQLLDRKLNIPQAIPWLAAAAVLTREQAALKLGFIEHFRSYAALAATGRLLVERWLARRGGGPGQPRQRWSQYAALLAEPVLPGELT